MWTRRTALLALGATAIAPHARAAGLLEAGASSSAAIALRPMPEQAGARMGPGFIGLSYEKAQLRFPYFTPANAALIGLYQRLGPGSLRMGGNAVDKSSWRGAVPGSTPVTPEQVDAFAAFVRRVGWSVIWGINFGHNTPEAAGDEAAYVARLLGPALQAFEIGNEPDLYARQGVRPAGFGYADFLAEWRRYAAAIQAAVPGAPLSGPASAYDLKNYTLPFASDERGRIALLTQHYYRGDGSKPTSTIDLLLAPDQKVASQARQLSAAARTNAVRIGARFDEGNSFYGGGAPGTSRSFGTALWSLDFLFQLAVNGLVGANLHGGGEGAAYTPIVDRQGVVIGPRPVYYGLLATAAAGAGRAVPIEAAGADPAHVSAYGVQRKDGLLNLVLINKNPAAALTIALPKTGRKAEILRLQGPALDALDGITFAGDAVGTEGSWHPRPETAPPATGTTTLDLPAASAALVRPTA